MKELSLSLLGGFYGKLGEKPLPPFRTRKAEALLVYIVTEAALSDNPVRHSRDMLMGLLWPERDQKSAQVNLRQILYQVRQVIPELPQRLSGQPIPLLLSDRETIAVNPRASYTLDIHLFLDHLASQEAHVCASDLCPVCLEALEEATTLYRGDFLEGVSLPSSQPFEEWVLLTREFLRRRALEALDTLSQAYLRREAWDAAVTAARVQLRVDPLRENAYRQLMVGLVRGGRRTEALQAYEKLYRQLQDELGVEPAETTRSLRQDILSRQVVAVEAHPSPELNFHLSPLFHNLPYQPPPFIGREEAMATVARRLQDPNCRLLSLVGPGGVGKTRLALEAAAAYSRDPQNRGGVYWVPLAPVHQAEQLPLAIGEALGLTFSGQQPIQDELLLTLQSQKMLLLLDNYEQLLPHTSLVRALLQRCAGVQLLITSRWRLGLQWEWLYEVEGLAVEMAGDAEAPALALFQHHVRRLNLNLGQGPGDRSKMLEICEAVEGLPLGLELAAVQLRQFTLEQVVKRLKDALDQVNQPAIDVPERHRSLWTSLDYSWDLLTSTEQELLARLSLFHGGFTAEAAVQVAGADPAQLGRLLDSSLLRKEGAVRYTLHQLVQQYAAEKLAERPQVQQETIVRHAAYYADMAAQLVRELEGSYDLVWALEPEIENLRLAWQQGVQQPHEPFLAQMAPALHAFYELKDWHAEGRVMFDEALEAVRGLQSATSNGRQQRTLGILLWGRAWLGHSGELEACYRMADESVEHLRAVDDRVNLAMALGTRGYLSASPARGELEKGIADLKAAIDLLDVALNRYILVVAHGMLGLIYERLGLEEESERWWQCCQVLAAGHTFSRMQALAHIHLADLARCREEYERAAELLEVGLALAQGGVDQFAYSDGKRVAGQLALDQGRYEAARDQLLEAYRISTSAERWVCRLELEALLGRAHLELGQEQAAAQHFVQALQQAQDLRLTVPTLHLLRHFAHFAASAESEWALTLLAFIREHREAPPHLVSRATADFIALGEQLPPTARASAEQQAQQLELWETVASWQGDLTRNVRSSLRAQRSW
jgi:predicted ATPase/DNA-binding SARP family transcriptional activator